MKRSDPHALRGEHRLRLLCSFELKLPELAIIARTLNVNDHVTWNSALVRDVSLELQKAIRQVVRLAQDYQH